MAKILLVSKYPRVREFIAEELAGKGHVLVAIGPSPIAPFFHRVFHYSPPPISPD
jgi:hypothetical protein